MLFRPPARQQFSEQLELLSGATSLFVPLSAVLPASKLQLPPGGLDFGCVPVRQPCVQQLPITNVGDAPLSFAWRLEPPFDVVPATGQLAQRPPAYSAKHVDGARAYALARRGELVELPAVPVMVHAWHWRGGRSLELDTEIRCGGGTYIRALARDLGRQLGSAAHCACLRRVASGPLSVTQAIPLDHLQPGSLVDGTHPLRSPREALGHLPHQEITDVQLTAVGQGRGVPASVAGGLGERGVLVHEGQVVAIAERLADDRWHPRVVLRGAAA